MTAKPKAGFTIVELLIVIVVIAILATVTVVAYSGIQSRTDASAVQSDLSYFAKKAHLFYVDNSRYPYTTNDFDSLTLSPAKISYHSTYYNYYYCTDFPNYSKFVISGRTRSGILYYNSSQGKGDMGNHVVGAVAVCGLIGLSGSGSDSRVMAGLKLSGSDWVWDTWIK